MENTKTTDVQSRSSEEWKHKPIQISWKLLIYLLPIFRAIQIPTRRHGILPLTSASKIVKLLSSNLENLTIPLGTAKWYRFISLRLLALHKK